MLFRAIPLWTIGLLALAGPSNSNAEDGFTQKADEYLKAQVRVNQFSGTVLVAQRGIILLENGYGLANRELNVANTPRTEFRIASVTKTFTATAILLLQEEGRLNVHDLLSKYWPDCPESWKAITLQHLLTHTSGIPEYADAVSWYRSMGQRMTEDQVIGLFRNLPLDFKPGTRYQYSNSGYYLLGCVIQRTSGQTYEAYLQQHIFTPLHMANTGCNDGTGITPDGAAGYSKNGGKWQNAALVDFSQAFSAGGIYSTVEDLYHFNQAFRDNSLLTRKSIDEMLSPFTRYYGYGWILTSRFDQKLIFHTGGNPGFTSSLECFPDKDVCVIVLSNQDYCEATLVARDLEAILFGAKYQLPIAQTFAEIDPAIYRRYVGTYESIPGIQVKIYVNGVQLMQVAPHGDVFYMIPKSSTEFFIKDKATSFSFVADGDGAASELVVHNGSIDIHFRRLP